MLTSTSARGAQRAVLSGPALVGASSTPARSLPLVIRQRRHSSSKHSSTPKQASVPVTETPDQAEAGSGKKRVSRSKASKEASKTKQSADKVRDNGVQPPSVPSTGHIDPKVVSLASLFAQHRPISLNQPIPAHDNQKSFDAIFAPRNPKSKAQDVIFTLASVVKQLEGAASGQGFEMGTSQTNINVEELAKSFRPFNAPPPPVPMDPAYVQKNIGRVATPAVSFGVEQAPMPEGAVAELFEPQEEGRAVQAPFRRRMRARQVTWLSGLVQRYREQLDCISVKRQRRLKMKKHKYKKLMRKTRNLRRRQDRL